MTPMLYIGKKGFMEINHRPLKQQMGGVQTKLQDLSQHEHN